MKLRDYFESDFKATTFRLSKSKMYSNEDTNEGVEIVVGLHTDHYSTAQFLSFYVPKCSRTVNLCELLLKKSEDYIASFNGDVSTQFGYSYETSVGPWNSIFARKIYVYVETILSELEFKVLDNLARQLNLHVTFRDTTYALTREFAHEIVKSTPKDKLGGPLKELQYLLSTQDNDEGKYQELLIKYPWIFGLEYKHIERHTHLDDKNIPDFTGVRVRDGFRDIFEIKPPFTKMFKKNGDFNNNFNEAWNQSERYINFVRQDADYLRRRKNLMFSNPKCNLILGLNLSETERDQIRRKEELLNSLITVWTYNDLENYIQSTIATIQKFD